jgi:hypothetical protein
MSLSSFADGARVRKPDAIWLDFAYQRTGTVCRKLWGGDVCVGVRWDGGNLIYEYSGDCLFAAAGD